MTKYDEPQQFDILNGEKKTLKKLKEQLTHDKQPNTQPTHHRKMTLPPSARPHPSTLVSVGASSIRQSET